MTVETIEAPLAPDQLARRWQALCADPTFEDIAGKIELTEWGEILMSPVGNSHVIAVMCIAETLRKALGGHTMGEVGVATSIGVRAPDVAWCSESYLAAHPEEMPLSSAPEICVEIVSASNALPKLREKAMAYVNAGAVRHGSCIRSPGDWRSTRARGAGKRRSSSAVDTGALFG